jgi:hypothetical protein
VSTPPPTYLHGLVDDAAIFPPGNAPLDEAVRAHGEHRQAPYAALVGPLVVGEDRLPQLLELAPDPAAGQRLAVAVVVSGGAGALEPAVRWAARSEALQLGGLELALRDSATGELAHNARRVVTAVDQLVSSGDLGEDVPVYVEMPRLYGSPPTPDWFGALDELAAAELRLKLRTGGEHPDAVPAPHELAGCIDAALDREMPFKCTAGLHHAVRHPDADLGVDRHGFLNVLVATRRSLDGDAVDAVAGVLTETDGTVLAQASDEAGLTSARRWFRSFGSCSIIEPVDDLTALGLLEKP